jgi:hypothetical protein
MLITALREVQLPLLATMLLGGCAAKLVRALRVGSLDAGLGPTALFPMRLRRPVAVSICVIEFVLGAGLIVTAGRIGEGLPAATVRLGTGVLFLVAACALIELRATHPDVGCGCFGDFSTAPTSIRALIRAALLAVAAFATIKLPALQLPQPGSRGILIGILVAELAVLGALSPELGEGLVRLGYSDPCELRRLPEHRTVSALRRSSQWRKHAALITADRPVDLWRELCWRYVVFPGHDGSRETEIVFAVYLRGRRPPIHAAMVDTATGEPLPWPAPRVRPPLSARLPGRSGLARQATVSRAGLADRPGSADRPGPADRPGSADRAARQADGASEPVLAAPTPRTRPDAARDIPRSTDL